MGNTRNQNSSTDSGWYDIIQVQFGTNTFGIAPMDISTSPAYKPVTVILSNNFEPFQDMNVWLEKIAESHLPASWIIQDEGPAQRKHLIWASPLMDDRLDLRITTGLTASEDCPSILNAVVKRKQLVNQFVKAFRTFIKKNYRPEHWSMVTDLREIDLTGVMLKLKKK
jgi:hypothetical protein